MANSTETQIQLALSRYKPPSAWDRVMQDEPLDPIEGEWVPDGGCNVSPNGTITIPVGTEVRASGHTYVVSGGMAYAGGATTLTVGYLYAGTMSNYGNVGEPHPPWDKRWVPYPRNRNEKRTFKAIERRLPELLRLAEQKFGPRGEGLESEWNASFWEMITRSEDHFLKTRK